MSNIFNHARSLVVVAAVAMAAACSGGEASDGSDSSAASTATTAEAATARAAAEENLEPTATDWSVMERASPEGEGREVVLAREAATGANSMGVAPTLYLSCASEGTQLYIVWYEDPEGNHNDVTTRIDDGREVRRTWSNDNGDSSYFPEDSASHFIRDLAEADSLTVDTNLYKRMPITAVFQLDGLGEELEPLREECDW